MCCSRHLVSILIPFPANLVALLTEALKQAVILPAVEHRVAVAGGIDYVLDVPPAEGKAWLGLGSDDGVKIWFNGELIHDKWIRRSSRVDDDVLPLHLKQGRNHILLKIQNATGDWSFIYRIRTEPK